MARVLHVEYGNLWTGCGAFRGVLTDMRLLALLFTATLAASPAAAQPASASPPADAASSPQDAAADPGTRDQGGSLPVSLAKIREALETTPLISLRTLDERPTFRLEIKDRLKIEELLATLNFKTGPIPAGGVTMAEQNRIMFPPVDNPTRQELGAFNQGELLTILIENLVGKYLAGKAGKVFDSRARAESAAKEEVRIAVAQYCGAQPNQGSGIQICDTPVR